MIMERKTGNTQGSLDDYRWLVGNEGRAWLARIREIEAEVREPLRVAARLRKDLGMERVRLLLEQTELRRRAGEKFPRAEEMFFTRKGFEQATDFWVAEYKAERVGGDVAARGASEMGASSGGEWADFCCGIGGDLMALGARGLARGVERDLVVALLAEANLEAVGVCGDVVAADMEEIVGAGMSGVLAWHIDPDRRPSGGRTTRVELHEPGPAVLRRLLDVSPNGAIKLAPAAVVSESWWGEAELEWISRGGQCRQLVAWFGALAEHAGRRRATVVRKGVSGQWSVVGEQELGGEGREARRDVATFVGEEDVECAVARRVGRFVFEPDAAVLAAKLEGDMARRNGLEPVAAGVAYFTGDALVEYSMLTAFEVMEVMPYRAAHLKQWLAERGIGRIEVKKRGVDLEPEKVRREIVGEGENAATVLLAKMGGRVRAIVARRRLATDEHG
jgi:hypothetical protein